MSIRRGGIAPALAAVLAVTGCGVHVDPVAVPPGGSVPSSAPGPDKVVGRYTKLNGTCPTLDGDTAKKLKLPATGTPAEANVDTPIKQIVACTWGTGVGSVSAMVSIDLDTGTPTAEERTAESFEKDWKASVDKGWTLNPRPAGGVGDKSYLGVHGDQRNVVLSFRASNAQVLVSYDVADLPANAHAAAIDKNAATLVALGRDIIDDLV